MNETQREEMIEELRDWRLASIQAMRVSDHEGLQIAQTAIAVLEDMLGIIHLKPRNRFAR